MRKFLSMGISTKFALGALRKIFDVEFAVPAKSLVRDGQHYILEPKRSATQRAKGSYGFRCCQNIAYIPPSGMLAIFFLSVYP